jgi:Rrf2 family protein
MISKTSLDGIKALVFLAKQPNGACLGAAEIASNIEAPANYLGKSLQSLAMEGFLESKRGHGGGFSLSKTASEISIFEIVGVLEDLTRLSQCIWNFSECNESSPCPLHSRWKEIREVYLNFLKKTTIADLVGDPNLTQLIQKGD